MSELFDSANIIRTPFELECKTSRAITGVESLGSHLYKIDWFYDVDTSIDLSEVNIFGVGDTVTLYKTGLMAVSGIVTISLDRETTVYCSLDLTDYLRGLMVKGATTDLISCAVNSFLELRSYDDNSMINARDGNEITFSSSIELELGVYRIVVIDKLNSKKYYFTKTLGTPVFNSPYYEYTFTDIYNDLVNVSIPDSVISFLDNGAVFDIQFESDNVTLFQTSLTPDKDLGFTINMKDIIPSFFTENINENFVNPLIVNGLTDNTSFFVRKINVSIALVSSNVNKTGSIEFYSTPFLSMNGLAPLTEYISNDNATVKKTVTAFDVLRYNVGGLILVGSFLRIRNGLTSGIVSKQFKDDTEITSNSLSIDGVGIKFITLQFTQPLSVNRIEFYAQLETTIQQVSEIQVMERNCESTLLMWAGDRGVNCWNMNTEFDATLDVSDPVFIKSVYNNTITRFNKDITRKLKLSSKLLTNSERNSIASVIRAKQCWIYSTTQQRLIPVSLMTNSMKLKQSDEVSFGIELDIEIDPNIIL